MGVKSEHSTISKAKVKWRRVRDVTEGQDAVHLAGTIYLPKLSKQSVAQYNAYKARTPFYNATWRTLAGFVGMLFRKPPTLNVSKQVEKYLEDVTLSGISFDTFAQNVALEDIEVSRVGILVDFPVVQLLPEQTLTQDEADKLGLRPTMQLYATESIYNWSHRSINNKYVLSEVRLKEVETYKEGEWDTKTRNIYRVLDLEPVTNLYRVRKYDENEKLIEGSEHYPRMNSLPMDFIPFYPVGPDGLDITIQDPVLIDLVDMNLAHYRVSADYEHGCHFCGLPTPYVTGYSPTDPNVRETFEIGSTAAWALKDPNATVGYLEFTGQGLDALKENLERKEQLMSILGARMLADEKNQVETYGATAIKRTGENSILAGISIAISNGLKEALKTFSRWAGDEAWEQVEYDLNRDFMPVAIEPQMLTAWLALVQAGKMSDQSLFALLQRGDLIEPEVTFELEQARSEIAEIPEPVAPDKKSGETKPEPDKVPV
jgi:Domain of unknown function (DUF4055)